MSFVSIAGQDAQVLVASISLPRIGVPQFVLSIAGELELPEAIEIRVGESLSWKATVRRQGHESARTLVRAVGGAGKLTTELAPRAYQGVPVRIPLEDVAKEAGERLSPRCDPGVLGAFLGKWVRIRQSASFALAALLVSAGGPAWRIVADGTLWVGVEAWPETKMRDFTVLAEAPHRGMVELVSLEPSVLPGEAFEGRPVSVVEHLFSDRRLRTRLYLEEA